MDTTSLDAQERHALMMICQRGELAKGFIASDTLARLELKGEIKQGLGGVWIATEAGLMRDAGSQ
jgi:hypothetical protein